MNPKVVLIIAVESAVALPYLLVLLWCTALSVADVLPNWQIPKPIRAVLFAGGILSLEARRDRFWSYMLWFPAFTIVMSVSRDERAGVLILGLHLLTALVLYLSGGRLTAMTRARHA